jgi:hypothetical protein
MKPQKQLHRHRPPTTWGDCFRTAIAIVLDMDAGDVPHFMDAGIAGEEAWGKAEAWLNARSLSSITIVFDGKDPLQQVLDSLAATNQRGKPLFLLGGQSRNGVNHFVVGCNGDIVCDPSLDDSGIVGPCDDGYYYVVFFGALAATDCAAKHARDAASKRDRLDAAAALLSADLIAAGAKRGDFYITIGDGELHVYGKGSTLVAAHAAAISCAYPVEWHEANVVIEQAAEAAA